jgi:hypothetical protein
LLKLVYADRHLAAALCDITSTVSIAVVILPW